MVAPCRVGETRREEGGRREDGATPGEWGGPGLYVRDDRSRVEAGNKSVSGVSWSPETSGSSKDRVVRGARRDNGQAGQRVSGVRLRVREGRGNGLAGDDFSATHDPNRHHMSIEDLV